VRLTREAGRIPQPSSEHEGPSPISSPGSRPERALWLLLIFYLLSWHFFYTQLAALLTTNQFRLWSHSALSGSSTMSLSTRTRPSSVISNM
jgi:hypothetical protein